MRDFWKQTVLLAAAGFALGMLVGLGFMAASGLREYCAENGAAHTAVYLALSGLLGAVNMGSSTIYSLEHWGILRCTLTHFLISMASVCAVGFSLGWLDPSDISTLWILPACLIVYFIIWLIMYCRYRRQIRRINDALKRWKAERKDDA